MADVLCGCCGICGDESPVGGKGRLIVKTGARSCASPPVQLGEGRAAAALCSHAVTNEPAWRRSKGVPSPQVAAPSPAAWAAAAILRWRTARGNARFQKRAWAAAASDESRQEI